MGTEEEIRRNIAARKNAEEALRDIEGYHIGVNQDRFWECLAIAAAARVGKVLTDDGPYKFPMDEHEAHRFEHRKVAFGRYHGRTVEECPPEYWAELANNDFNVNLRRYVQSDHFRRKVGLLSDNIATRTPVTRGVKDACIKSQKK